MGEEHTKDYVRGKIDDQWSYGVLVWSVPPSNKYSEDSPKLLFQLKDWVLWLNSGEGPFPKRYSNIFRCHYKVSGRLSVSGGREDFKGWLDRRNVPLPAQDATLRLVFDNPKWEKTQVAGLMVRMDTFIVREGEGEDEEDEDEHYDDDDDDDDYDDEDEDDDEDGMISYETLQTLERLTITPSPSVQESECAVCLEELELSLAVRGIKLPCSHVFHEKCILEWFFFEHRFCPKCRFKLPVCPRDCECEDCNLGRQFGEIR